MLICLVIGSVHSSQEFVIGLGRGTKNLLSSVVTGAMDSTAAIVGTATKGIELISFRFVNTMNCI